MRKFNIVFKEKWFFLNRVFLHNKIWKSGRGILINYDKILKEQSCLCDKMESLEIAFSQKL